MFKIIWLFLIITLTGCASHFGEYRYTRNGREEIGKEYIMYVDSSFGEMDMIEIDNAVNQWNYSLNGAIRIKMVRGQGSSEGNSWIIKKIDSKYNSIPDFWRDGRKYYVLAWANKIGGDKVYVIRDRVISRWIHGLMMHEIGHLLGADHDSGHLMKYVFNENEYRCIDYTTMKQVATYNGLDLRRLNYCTYERDTTLNKGF
jgi:hypothetical protein